MSTTDISSALIAKSDQLNNIDLIGGDIVIEITKVTNKKTPEQPLVINYKDENGHPWKPSKSMGRVMAMVWKSTEGSEWIGRKVKLFRNPDVTFGNDKTGGIQIREMSHISSTMTVIIPKSRGRFTPYTVHPLVDDIAPAAPRLGQAESNKAVNTTDEEFVAAKVIAQKGSQALEEWWVSLRTTKGEQARYSARMPELKRLADVADAGPPPDPINF